MGTTNSRNGNALPPVQASVLRILVLSAWSLFAATASAQTPAPPGGYASGEVSRVRAVTKSGKPVKGVWVYHADSQTGAEYLATTGADGRTKPVYVGGLLGLAADGRIAYNTTEDQKLVFGPMGTVTLHVIDEHGAPIADHEVILERSSEVMPLRPYGFQWFDPGYPKEIQARLAGKTNSAGNVSFSKLPKGVGFMVITSFGPTFDPGLGRLNDPNRQSMDIMGFQGAVMADKPANIVIAHDRGISGRVTRFGSGAPVSGIPVVLTDTGFGHMIGYPGTQLRTVKTDSSGAFQFISLPNCSFKVGIGSLPQEPKTSYALESRIGTAAWALQGIATNDFGFSGSDGTEIWLRHTAIVQCDFRLSEPATVVVTLRNPENVPLKGMYIRCGSSLETINRTMQWTFHLLHGPHTFTLIGENEERKLGAVTVAEGTTSSVQFVVPRHLKG